MRRCPVRDQVNESQANHHTRDRQVASFWLLLFSRYRTPSCEHCSPAPRLCPHKRAPQISLSIPALSRAHNHTPGCPTSSFCSASLLLRIRRVVVLPCPPLNRIRLLGCRRREQRASKDYSLLCLIVERPALAAADAGLTERKGGHTSWIRYVTNVSFLRNPF
jgi:hypothetical protein